MEKSIKHIERIEHSNHAQRRLRNRYRKSLQRVRHVLSSPWSDRNHPLSDIESNYP